MAELNKTTSRKDQDTELKRPFLHYWEVMWAWLSKPVVQRRSIYLLFLLFLFYVPLPYFGRTVQDWFWDRGLFFDPKHEGAIIVDSPQLFTRERLINQRLSDSRWIDDRIKAVDAMIEENRFGLPDKIRNDFLKKRLEVSAPTSNDAIAQQESEQAEALSNTAKIYVGPRLEFQDAHEYRRYLVQTKYEYVLDDAHDSHSNTLHQLNLNLFVSPGRTYGSSIAAVSVRLQEPTDPQWLLQKYGALLLDMRKELSDIVQNLIQDRASILRDTGSSGFPAELDVLLYRMVLESASSAGEAQRFIEHARGLHEQDWANSAIYNLRRSMSELAPGTNIGFILEKYFSEPKKNNKDFEKGNIPKPIKKAFDTLLADCGKPVRLINLLPDYFFSSDSEEFHQLKAEILKNWSNLFPEVQLVNGNSALDLMARRILHNSTIQSVPCLSRASGSIAMLGALGRIKLDAKGALPARADECFPKGDEGFEEYTNNVEHTDFVKMFCPGLRKQLVGVGLVHLVREELVTTTAESGRLRTLNDYFHLDADDCTLISCKIRVMTIAESERDKIIRNDLNSERSLNALNEISQNWFQYFNSYESKSFKKNITERRKAEQKRLQKIGEREALRLFAELACFSNARSYAVYPRKGDGQNIQRTRTEQRTLWSLVSGSSVSVSDGNSQSELSRRNSIFGIGDSGQEQRDKELECGPAFLRILNTLDPTEDVIVHLQKVLGPKDTDFDPRWKATMRCLLHVEKSPPQGRIKAREKCHGDKPTPYDRAPEMFDIYDLTSVVRHLRQRETTVSWIVPPLDMDGRGTQHELKSEPLSALVSIPSWWPGLELVIETCWLRSRWIGNETSKSLCQDTPASKASDFLTIFDKFIKRAKGRGRIESFQIVPLPHDLDDVLPKLGFFIVNYPYLDNLNRNSAPLETGRKVELRLTGKRLWKNPRVRIGEQWHDEVQVLPDMQGIIATFYCLDPIRQPGRIMVDERHLKRAENDKKDSPDRMLSWAQTRNDRNADELYNELRQVQVWTSEGETNPTSLEVISFRPVSKEDARNDQPCWRIGAPLMDEE